MKFNRAIKYRAYPTIAQMEFFIKTFGCTRKIWNLMLSDKIEHYKLTGKSINPTPAQYKDAYPYLKEVDSLALANVQMNLNSAYREFFKKNQGFPKFKSKKHSFDSYTTNNQGNTISLENGYVKLPKIGLVKIKLHRQPKQNWKLKSATISQSKSGKFYISCLFEFEQEIPKVNYQSAIGFDYKSDGFAVSSDGETIGSPKYYRRSQQKLAKLQRQFVKTEIGSNRRDKIRKKIAKQSEHIANQRKDFCHKLSYAIAKQYDVVCVEDINLQNISRRLRLGKSTNDNGFGMFRTFLAYKLAESGKLLVKVDRWTPTSTVCSECGCYHKDIVNNLSVREWTCPDCGATHDRDINAARNIVFAGLIQVGLEQPELIRSWTSDKTFKALMEEARRYYALA